MQLPPLLRHAIDDALEGVALADLAAASDALSRRYRGEVHDGRWHLADERAALAYLAARLPATYAAVRATFAAVAGVRPDFAPVTALDAGAGPGTALWAAADCWSGLADVLLIEGSDAIRAWGERLAAAAGPARIVWRAGDLGRGIDDCGPRDLVTLAYVLGEIAPERRGAVVDRLWQLTGDVMVVVEPGTPAGWQRIVAARAQLMAAGAAILAPCPHAAPCPLATPDWCHFAARVARSRRHREVKNADVPWEDEKFIYLAAARTPGKAVVSRVIAPPRMASGRVMLKLCRSDGSADERLVTRREGAAFKAARRTDWGGEFGF
ncbi:MAG TPA: small ribosomal subunit Rsm22 family protein [Xanthobacteraceae bacterium]|nr:small ribosomal subunit Rsm22 family protein [Xanthobacteraceae bacterium]